MDSDPTPQVSVPPDQTSAAERGGHRRLADELRWLRLMLAREVVRFRRGRPPGPPEGLQGVYIPDDEVDRVLGARDDPARQDDAIARITDEADALRGTLAPDDGSSGLDRLVARFGLSAFDRLALLAACAPDLDAGFETIFAYLHDDLTRRRPSAGLVLSLWSPVPEEQWALRARLGADCPLLSERLVRMPGDVPFLARPLSAYDRVVDEVAGVPVATDARLRGLVTRRPPAPWSTVDADEDLRGRLEGLGGLWAGPPFAPVALFDGPYGSGHERAAAALAGACGRSSLEVGLARLLDGPDDVAETLAVLRRDAVLGHALLMLDCGELTAAEEPTWARLRHALSDLLSAAPVPIVMAFRAPVDAGRLFPGVSFLGFRFAPPPPSRRAAVWRDALEGEGLRADAEAVGQVAGKFVLSAGQIRDAAATASQLAALRGDAREAGATDLHAAARAHSHHGLAALARKIEPLYGWEDIVLPRATRRQLGEIAAAMEHRDVVLGSWGFGAKLARGKGLTALFSGASGTGKTMATEVIAGALGLDLYAIDLATVVSKYVGETEKNLRRIFDEAQSSNAILFFDEADALFGKRSEVRDSHDRYANIEIAYLLGLMEAYEGMAVLATNLSKNIDDAFARRTQYVVEFPFPDEALRRGIWERAFPDRAPLDDGVEIPLLARSFELAGGSIKGAALAAATLAARDGGVITMDHIALAVAREYQKLGRLPSQSEFGRYYGSVLEQLGSGA